MTRAVVKRLGSGLAVGLLAACATVSPPVTIDNHADVVRSSEVIWPVQQDAVGRLGPDGGPAIADRGIGGTGSPAAFRTVERGIGGTGIVGVVTGFGSVFVDGIEIQYDDSASVDIDGSASPAGELRAGQLVAIQADGPAAEPRAKAISVRSAVIGRIEALELGSGSLTIGGQAVSVPRGTWGANHFGLGDWVKVSGLRRSDGTIVASRLDAAPAGVLSARGRVVRDGTVARVGNLVLPGPVAAGVTDGQFVVVSGDYVAGHGRVSTVAPDTLFPNPAEYFGPSASHLIVQAFVEVTQGAISMNGVKVSAEAVVSGQARHDGMAVVSLERGADGSYIAVGLRYAGYRGDPQQSLRRRPAAQSGDPAQTSQRGEHAGTAPPSQPDADNGSSASGPVATASINAVPDYANGASTAVAPISPVATQPGLLPNVIVPNPIVTPSVTDEAAAALATVHEVVEAPKSESTGVTVPPVTTPPAAGSVPPPTLPPTSKTLPPGSSSSAVLKGSTSTPTVGQITGAVASGSGTSVSRGSLGLAAASRSSPLIGTKSGSVAGSGLKPTAH